MAGTLACSVVAAGRVLLGRLVVVAADTVPVDTALVRTANSPADSDMAYLHGEEDSARNGVSQCGRDI